MITPFERACDGRWGSERWTPRVFGYTVATVGFDTGGHGRESHCSAVLFDWMGERRHNKEKHCWSTSSSKSTRRGRRLLPPVGAEAEVEVEGVKRSNAREWNACLLACLRANNEHSS